MEYGVVMKRQNDSLRMDRILSKNEISEEAINQLARQVADFHKDAAVISTPFDLNKAKELFQDLQSVLPHFEQLAATEWTDLIEKSIRFSDGFLTENQDQFIARTKADCVRDVHGDLHSKNIFLNPRPTIFDCIEFNDTFRQIDVWYEVAFLCMDMEYYGHRELSEEFFREYNSLKGESSIKENERIFIYFKMLRANVRAKVMTLKVSEEISSDPNLENLSDPIRYLSLMRTYMEDLVQSNPQKG